MNLEENKKIIKIDNVKIYFSYTNEDINEKKIKEIYNKYSIDLIIIFIIKNNIDVYMYSEDLIIPSIFKKYEFKEKEKIYVFSKNEENIEKLINEIINEFKNNYNPIILAKDIMSYPVRTVLAGESIEKVYRLMMQTGHNGFPVIDNNELIGIITRKDVEKAINHNLSKYPVKKFISKNIISVLPKTPIEEVRMRMLENGVGRVLVIDENNTLTGIITRSDILKGKIFHKSQPNIIIDYEEKLHKYNVLKKMVKIIDPKYMNLLRLLGVYGTELNMPVYLVGGFVRDLLLERKNFDIDIVVEGDGLKYAKYASRNLRATFVEHSEFHTGSLFFKDGFRIDIATARTEYYEKPADLPKVELSTIKKDLYRRDFSINAMAIKLNSEEFGVLLDFFGCKNDLDNGIIRVLYNLSFIEDPTRILRAIRFEKRFNFQIEKNTIELLKDAVNNNYIEKVTGMRLREEFEKILSEKNIINSLNEMGELKILDHLFLYSEFKTKKIEAYNKVLEFYNWIKENIPEYLYKVKKFHLFLYTYLLYESKEAIIYSYERYGLPKKFLNNIDKLKEVLETFNTSEINKLSDIYKLVETFDNELLISLGGLIEDDTIELYKKYLFEIKDLKLNITGTDLINLGIKGRLIGKILNEIKLKKLDENIDEKEYLNKIVRELNERV
ncbi:CBS domain-containing protein [Marinitoga litoralis]|uniref:CBS domain-containing protein n=1 Tax=Marinitoga litoralis TaxID=570855 RepID=UPI0019611199|nr:CBS domain-containing protein [Marinitoga litoralis]MBM7558286.1 tRNA nucleotidyltransferase (CCA-adding enzyme) [Marinitoga litoralis]